MSFIARWRSRAAFAGVAAALAVVVAAFPRSVAGQTGGAEAPEHPASFALETPRVVLTGVPFEVVVTPQAESGDPLPGYRGTPRLDGVDQAGSSTYRGDGAVVFSSVLVEDSGRFEISAADGAARGAAGTRAIPGIWSLAPPMLAILLAILFRQVVLALVAGVWIGSTLLLNFNPLAGFFEVGSRYVIGAVTDSDRAHIIIFSMMFGGLAGILSRSGGARGFAQLITSFARTARRGQVSTMVTALVVFFDDYANVIIRGNLMRPITDGLRVSREKLAFLTDTGAASVASTVIVSTWVGYEVGLIDQGLELIDYPEDGYSVFLRTIPYRFYPIFSFALALAVGFLGRDFGPMRAAEERARRLNQPLRPGSEPATESLDEDPGVERINSGLWMGGVFPVLAVLVTAGIAIWLTGTRALAAEGVTAYGLREIVTNSDSYIALLWASVAGCVTGIVLAVARRILSLGSAIGAWIAGLRSMVLAIVILVLAWSIGDVTAELHAAQYLVQVLQNVLNPSLLPTLTFVVAGVMAFATGTSWATMAVLMPLVIPLSHALAQNAGLAVAVSDPILMGVVGAVLAGAVFGDHCSPISDTTVLSSMASACDHLDHVKTQLPYALSAAGIAIVLGILPTSFGVSPGIALIAGIAAAILVVRLAGARIEEGSAS
ncbi:MAG: Na+/H+ antiporter NhaC family protein [Acidobacteria bacterium]|nr:Na+/H+ antiporter NhaC family protein [Acidobacteriota bacterium]